MWILFLSDIFRFDRLLWLIIWHYTTSYSTFILYTLYYNHNLEATKAMLKTCNLDCWYHHPAHFTATILPRYGTLYATAIGHILLVDSGSRLLSLIKRQSSWARIIHPLCLYFDTLSCWLETTQKAVLSILCTTFGLILTWFVDFYQM